MNQLEGCNLRGLTSSTLSNAVFLRAKAAIQLETCVVLILPQYEKLTHHSGHIGFVGYVMLVVE